MKRSIVRALVIATVIVGLAATAVAQPNVTRVVNAASFETLIAPGSLVSIFGDQLALSTAVSSELPLPKMLDGVTVTIGGMDAPLYCVSPRQINAPVPFETSGAR
ncbi:MAG: hypothetical protein GY953_32320, partial [bacterium]|nr:hypothetical protein [bacterium]